MVRPFQAIKVGERVHWVGAIDWALRDFHGYATPRGSTYNAYLILDEKITLVDTVKAPFCEEMLARISSVVDPADIDYIISNHSEMDHSGSLPRTAAAVRPEKVFASVMGVRALPEHFDPGCELTAVQDGETLCLGGSTVTFLEARMLHWPDSMLSYLTDDGILFSSDAFGMHLASVERFDDELPADLLEYEAAKYYANILLLYSPVVTRFLERVEKIGLAPAMIAPDHGPIWRGDPARAVRWYARWARQEPTNKAVVIYDTMWGSTEKMARAVEQGLVDVGAGVQVLAMKASTRSDVVTEILDAGAIVVGSPTINNGVFPTLADVLTYLKGLKPQNLIGAAFGSYGWSGESVPHLNRMLEGMGVELVAEGAKALYVPSDDALEQCRDLGAQVGRALAEKCRRD